MTDKLKEATEWVRRKNGKLAWLLVLIVGAPWLYPLLSDVLGEARKDGVEAQKIETHDKQIGTLKEDIRAIRRDVTTIKIQVSEIATRLEQDDASAP